MILRQDSTRPFLAPSQFLEAAITYFSFFFFIPLVNQVPSRSHAVHKLTTWITGRDISKVTSSLATTRGYESGDRGTHYNFRSSVESRERAGERENARNRRRERGREREPTTTANRKGQTPERDNARTRRARGEARSGTANENDQQIATSSRWNGVSNSLDVIVGIDTNRVSQGIANIPGRRRRAKPPENRVVGPLSHANARAAALVLRGGNDSC